jgi:hypothetical protein
MSVGSCDAPAAAISRSSDLCGTLIALPLGLEERFVGSHPGCLPLYVGSSSRIAERMLVYFRRT